VIAINAAAVAVTVAVAAVMIYIFRLNLDDVGALFEGRGRGWNRMVVRGSNRR
jgi:hypothetical protein